MPIFDQGYQHWEGTLSGHAWRWLAIVRQGVKVQMRNRWTRIVTLLAMGPAFGLVGLMVMWGLLLQNKAVSPIFEMIGFSSTLVGDPKSYTGVVWTLAFHFFFQIQVYFAMILVVLVGPGLISQDLRFNALPLYFSRPLRRVDYFMGKLGIIAAFLSVVTIVPAVLAYLLGIAFSFDLNVLRDTFWLLPGSILYGLVIVISAGTLMLALSALTRSSRYVGGMWIGFWIITAGVAGVLAGIQQTRIAQEAYRQVLAEEQRQMEMEMQENRARQVDMQREPMQPGQPVRPRHRDRYPYRYHNIRARFAETARNSWYPVVSYMGNLQRIERAVLDTDSAWRRVAPFLDRSDPETGFNEWSGPGYPWYWSAGVLVALWGLSLWILSSRVKSLDRLK